MKDCVYYLWVNGQMLMIPFANEEEAHEHAKNAGYEDYEIEPWEVD